jgi:hypothetical protein
MFRCLVQMKNITSSWFYCVLKNFIYFFFGSEKTVELKYAYVLLSEIKDLILQNECENVF